MHAGIYLMGVGISWLSLTARTAASFMFYQIAFQFHCINFRLDIYHI